MTRDEDASCEVCGRKLDDDTDPWCSRCRAVMGAIAAGAPPFLAVEAAASVAIDQDPDFGTHVIDDTWVHSDEQANPLVTRPPDDPPPGLFPAPAPAGLTPADLDVPDDRWRAAAKARRTS